MGIYSDLLEKNREYHLIDPCMFIGQSGSSVNWYSLLWKHFCEVDNCHSQLQNQEFSNQARILHNISEDEKKYLSLRYLIDISLYREKQLLSLNNNHRFCSHIVNNTIDEYLSVIRESYHRATKEYEYVKKHLQIIPEYSFSINEKSEKNVLIVTLLDNLFYYLSNDAEFTDSHLLQSLFIDISQLIILIDENLKTKKPKEICRYYYEKTFHPTFGIDRCDNCDEPLYKECPYCFNCFVRS